MFKQITILSILSVLITACSSVPQHTAEPRPPAAVSAEEHATEKPQPATTGGGYLPGDGPGVNAPLDIKNIPDAIPISEPLHKYANRPYIALGKTYTPMTAAGIYKVRGIASWYGKKFHGQRTSSGETYDMYGMSAAHPTLPIPSYARVTNIASQKSVIVRINDRGPFMHDRVIDLSYSAAYKLGMIGNGSAEVEIESITAEAGATVPARTDEVQTMPLAKSEPITTSSLPTEVVPAAAPVPSSAGGNVYLQLGAFKSQESAESFMAKMRSELANNDKQFSLYQKDGLVRVHLGPYADQNEARNSAEVLQQKLGFKPMLNLH